MHYCHISEEVNHYSTKPNSHFLGIGNLHHFFHNGLLDLGFPFSTTYNQYRLFVGVCPF
jgi:hypothetical protein